MRLAMLEGLRLEGAALTRPKPLLLLGYLALEGPKERRFLAELFWPEAKDPLGSLSVALSQIRKGAPGALRETGGRLGTPLETDVAALSRRVAAGDWEAVLREARGAFLAGLRLSLGPELEEWVFSWRERIDGWVAEAHQALAEAALAEGRRALAQSHAEAAYDLLGNGSAGVPRRLLRLLKATGSPRVRGPRTSPPPCRVPTSPTPFVGRSRELTELLSRLEGGCRWVSLVGLGGVGKTRLAQALAGDACRRRLFADGVYWVDLESTTTPLPEAVAAALGLAIREGTGWERLALAFGDRQALVVLDGIDPEKAELQGLAAWLKEAPGLRVLATARYPLGLKAEWVYPLGGLRLDPAGPEGRSEAARLFLVRARQAGAQELDPKAVETLCREMDGHPMAIELAAAWTPVLPVHAIARRIVREGALPPRYRDSKEQEGLAEIIEAAYRLLPAGTRRAFRQLAVFAGGFTPQAAERIGAARPEDLALLVDRALLTGRRGRLFLHPLLASHAARRLDAHPGEARAVRLRHARHFLSLLAGPGWLTPEHLTTLSREWDNLRSAWEHASRMGLWPEIGEARLSARLLLDNLGRFAEGLRWMETALAHAPPDPLAGLLALDRAWFLVRLGRLDEARAAIPDAAFEDPEVERWRRFTLGLLAYRQGAHAQAEAHWRAVLARPADPLNLRARHNLALAVFAQGRLEEARRLLSQALAEAREQESAADAVRVQNNLGNLLRILGRLEEAHDLLLRGLAEAVRLDLGQLRPYLRYNLGQVALDRGRVEEAAAHFHRARAEVRRTGERVLEASCCLNLGRALLALERAEEAESWLRQGLTLAWRLGELPEVLRGLTLLAELRARQDRRDEAARLLATVRAHPATRGHNRKQAEGLLSRLPEAAAYPSLVAALTDQGLAPAYPPLTGKG